MSEELKARIAELERQLAESRDFAISEAAKIRAEYERQQAVLVEALNHTAQYIAWREFGECRGFDAAIATPTQVIEIARAALAAVKPAGQEGGDRG